LLAAWVQSCVGTGAGYVALLLLTYRHLHTSWAVAAVLLAEFVPAIAFGSWFGGWADRYSRRLLIVAGNLMQAVAYGALAFAHTGVPIVGLALLAGVGNSLQRPSLRAALPVVAGDARQVAAAWFDTCRWVGLTVGPLVAAALIAISGTALPLAVNAVSFVIAAAAVATIAVDTPAGARTEEHMTGSGLRDGLAIAFAAPSIATVIACSAGAVIAGGLLNVCEPIFATHVLHGSGSDYALLVTCYGVGMVAAATRVARRGEAAAGVLIRRYLAAVVLSAAGLSGSAIAGSLAVATVAFAVTGYANALQLVSATQLIQLRVANAVQGRLFGAKDTVEGVSFLLGLVGAGALVTAVGVRLTLATGALICAACAVVAAAMLHRSASAATAPVPARDAVGPDLLPVVPPPVTFPLPAPVVDESRRSA